MQRTPLVKWPLGDAGGSCVGAAVWFAVGHVVRIARGWHGLCGVEGKRGHAPWLRVAAGGRGFAGPQSGVSARAGDACAAGLGHGASLRASRELAAMDTTI
eukprot:9498164-Pyramimonas_sp.AAC.1